jgi:DNA-binding transcriptional LysR family regulator
MPNLDVDLLRAFIAVAELRSFTRAAMRLHRTQSAVSMQIQRLEARVGARLFVRTRSLIELAPEGERLLDTARRMVALNDEAVRRIRNDSIAARVRLGVMRDYGTRVLPRVLADFMAAHRSIEVEVETGLTASMPARLGEDLDLAIVMHREGEGGGELLWREQAVWAAGLRERVEWTDPLPVALYPRGCLFRTWAMAALDAVERPWRLAFVSESPSAVEAIAAQGLAVTVVKRSIFPRGLRQLSDESKLPELPKADIRLHRAKRLSRAGEVLAEHLLSATRCRMTQRHP